MRQSNAPTTGFKPKLIERRRPDGVNRYNYLGELCIRRMKPACCRWSCAMIRQQTAGVLRALADRSNGKGPAEVDFQPWHALQTWLELGGGARCDDPLRSRVGRRDRPGGGAHPARFRGGDHLVRGARGSASAAPVGAMSGGGSWRHWTIMPRCYDLVVDLVSQGVKLAVSKEIRATVEAVAELGRGDKFVTVKQVGDRLSLDKSAASRRVRVALAKTATWSTSRTKISQRSWVWVSRCRRTNRCCRDRGYRGKINSVIPSPIVMCTCAP